MSDTKHEKPRVLLADLSSACSKALVSCDYRVTRGTFGTPLDVVPSGDWYPVEYDWSMPELREHDIVVVQMRVPSTDGHKPTYMDNSAKRHWQRPESGIVDPRPLKMHHDRGALADILQAKGLLVVLASNSHSYEYWYGTAYIPDKPRGASIRSTADFLPVDGVALLAQDGSEVRVTDRVLQQSLVSAEQVHYRCLIGGAITERPGWIPLATNKHGQAVAGRLMLKDGGGILFLPQIPNIESVICDLLEKCASVWWPHLFPHLERFAWLSTDEYEMPQIQKARVKIRDLRSQTEQEIRRLKAEIAQVRDEHPHWYNLLKGTGDELVEAVIHALDRCGFSQVVDVDEERRASGSGASLREDIDVLDGSPALVIDVKGLSGHPSDEDCHQGAKHALMRMREWDRTDVQSLMIVNHQRHIAPHDRDSNPFRKEIVENAKMTAHGLMTSWDLFNLLRNKERLGWSDEQVRAVFFRSGLIRPVPGHYVLAGSIVDLWDDAFSVALDQDLSTGRTLAIRVDSIFHEVRVDSLQVDREATDRVSAGTRCGIGYPGASSTFRVGQGVFLVAGKSEEGPTG